KGRLMGVTNDILAKQQKIQGLKGKGFWDLALSGDWGGEERDAQIKKLEQEIYMLETKKMAYEKAISSTNSRAASVGGLGVPGLASMGNARRDAMGYGDAATNFFEQATNPGSIYTH